jgi:hypothetical protein
MSKSVIYIPLLDEGTQVWRPTEGEEIADMIFRVLPTPNYDPEGEQWAFPPGTIVRCIYKMMDKKVVLVVAEKV